MRGCPCAGSSQEVCIMSFHQYHACTQRAGEREELRRFAHAIQKGRSHISLCRPYLHISLANPNTLTQGATETHEGRSWRVRAYVVLVRPRGRPPRTVGRRCTVHAAAGRAGLRVRGRGSTGSPAVESDAGSFSHCFFRYEARMGFFYPSFPHRATQPYPPRLAAGGGSSAKSTVPSHSASGAQT